jgi:DNA-binding NtrC family response regulator
VRTRTPIPALATEAKAVLESYDYPGNVRELEHLMNKLAVHAAGLPITAKNVHDELRVAGSQRSEDWRAWESLPFHESVARWERHLIERALGLSDGNKSEAARRLGIQRRLLYEKLQQF